jgi:enoyl-CoA hydratase
MRRGATPTQTQLTIPMPPASAPSLVRRDRRDDGVVTIILDNPPLNLVTRALTDALLATLEALAADEGVRVVVLTGAGGRAFCAGSDVKEFPGVRDDVIARKLAAENEVMHRLEELPQPVIAAIEGAALGAGCELAVACDLRVLAHTARIGLPEAHLGVIPGSGGLFRLPRLVGPGRAREMVYLGQVVDAEEALRIGLANRVAAAGEARVQALALAGQLARGSQQALRAAKQGFRETAHGSSREAARRTYPLSERVFRSADLTEGLRAFLEKRPPQFE